MPTVGGPQVTGDDNVASLSGVNEFKLLATGVSGGATSVIHTLTRARGRTHVPVDREMRCPDEAIAYDDRGATSAPRPPRIMYYGWTAHARSPCGHFASIAPRCGRARRTKGRRDQAATLFPRGRKKAPLLKSALLVFSSSDGPVVAQRVSERGRLPRAPVGPKLRQVRLPRPDGKYGVVVADRAIENRTPSLLSLHGGLCLAA
ncbi:hypothetical protein MTO96_002928 [Rhipicephalus appendiculatus]